MEPNYMESTPNAYCKIFAEFLRTTSGAIYAAEGAVVNIEGNTLFLNNSAAYNGGKRTLLTWSQEGRTPKTLRSPRKLKMDKKRANRSCNIYLLRSINRATAVARFQNWRISIRLTVHLLKQRALNLSKVGEYRGTLQDMATGFMYLAYTKFYSLAAN